MANGNHRKYFSISMVKNEADIIESFIRYHQHIFDGMIILDNQSSDNTLTILNQLKAEGIPLVIWSDRCGEYLPDHKFTELLYQTFSRYNPDIIFPLDADEFLVSANKVDHTRRTLDSILELNNVYYIDRVTYVPNTGDDENELFIPKRITHVRINDLPRPKVAVTKTIFYQFHPSLSVGNHELLFRSSRPEAHRRKTLEGIRLAHYPIRSIGQLKSKIFVGWMNSLSRFNKKPSESWHRQKLFHQLKEKQTMSYSEFIQIVKGFALKSGEKPALVHDPIDLSFCKTISMKYTTGNEVNFIKNVIDNYESLAKEYLRLKQELFAGAVDDSIPLSFKNDWDVKSAGENEIHTLKHILEHGEWLAKEYAKLKRLHMERYGKSRSR